MKRHNLTANLPEVNLSCRLEKSFWKGACLFVFGLSSKRAAVTLDGRTFRWILRDRPARQMESSHLSFEGEGFDTA
jgi:hypothetical protein